MAVHPEYPAEPYIWVLFDVNQPDTIGGPDVVAGMAARGFTIGGGYGKLKPVAFRIGHMGDHTVEELDTLLNNLEEVLLT